MHCLLWFGNRNCALFFYTVASDKFAFDFRRQLRTLLPRQWNDDVIGNGDG